MKKNIDQAFYKIITIKKELRCKTEQLNFLMELKKKVKKWFVIIKELRLKLMIKMIFSLFIQRCLVDKILIQKNFKTAFKKNLVK